MLGIKCVHEGTWGRKINDEGTVSLAQGQDSKTQ